MRASNVCNLFPGAKSIGLRRGYHRWATAKIRSGRSMLPFAGTQGLLCASLCRPAAETDPSATGTSQRLDGTTAGLLLSRLRLFRWLR
jgi:hypothetical protein